MLRKRKLKLQNNHAFIIFVKQKHSLHINHAFIIFFFNKNINFIIINHAFFF